MYFKVVISSLFLHLFFSLLSPLVNSQPVDTMGFFHSAPEGVLTVQLIEARQLHSEDFFGKNDPFVELYLDKKFKQRSTTIPKEDNPVWNQTFSFNIEKGSSAHKLYYDVQDKDMVGSDTIGEGSVKFSDAFDGKAVDVWGNLPAKLGLTSHGELHFYITFQPTGPQEPI
jgi:Ca2+-dependent lipid-binding protein